MAEQLNFEAAMARLEEITRLLERGDISLEQSLSLFEEGTALVGSCRAMLDAAEQKVKLLTKNADGKPAIADYEATDEQ